MVSEFFPVLRCAAFFANLYVSSLGLILSLISLVSHGCTTFPGLFFGQTGMNNCCSSSMQSLNACHCISTVNPLSIICQSILANSHLIPSELPFFKFRTFVSELTMSLSILMKNSTILWSLLPKGPRTTRLLTNPSSLLNTQSRMPCSPVGSSTCWFRKPSRIHSKKSSSSAPLPIWFTQSICRLKSPIITTVHLLHAFLISCLMPSPTSLLLLGGLYTTPTSVFCPLVLCSSAHIDSTSSRLTSFLSIVLISSLTNNATPPPFLSCLSLLNIEYPWMLSSPSLVTLKPCLCDPNYIIFINNYLHIQFIHLVTNAPRTDTQSLQACFYNTLSPYTIMLKSGSFLLFALDLPACHLHFSPYYFLLLPSFYTPLSLCTCSHPPATLV
ncbi:uncharacterized protein LOC132392705 [Hypanus sabinus]|uniref:uncharacterized protein LOC132392705 n=1 Tax=Hypanus sabinus TaxID=79690 RepID=UPI0028C507A2|nr:uncharacterized protein LOC132392705 [Hypanus sabinus]